jgi:hypothetical protein
MTYSVNLTDGTPLVTVNDGALNTTYSTTLVGKGYADYATVFAANSIHQLENYASTIPPMHPLVGQLWFNKTSQTLYIYTSNGGANGNPGFVIVGKNSTNTTLNTDSMNANSAVIGNLAVINLSAVNAVIKNLVVTDSFIYNKAQIGNVTAGSSTSGNYTGPIGLTSPNTGAFTSVTATSIKSPDISGYFNGVIGNRVPNVAAFTQVTAVRVTAQDFFGNITGPINQSGLRYPGSFTSLVADNFQVNNNFGADMLSATKGINGLILTNNQPYINSLGTLTKLDVTGAITAGNVTAAILNGVLGPGPQPNITSLGNLSSITVTGTATVGKLVTGILQTQAISGNILTPAQPNITSLGTLTGLAVTSTISGNINGSANSSIYSQQAVQARFVTDPIQNLITALPNMQLLTVRGNVDLGLANTISVGGGSPGAVLGLGNNNKLAWLSPAVLPNQTNQANKVLSTNGTVAQWIDAPVASSVVNKINTVSYPTAVEFTSGEAAHTAHTVLTITDPFDFYSATIWMQFTEITTNENYSGLVTINDAGSNKYRVVNSGFSGGDKNFLQISGQDHLGSSLQVKASASGPIEIKLWNIDVLYGKTRSTLVVNLVNWHWVTRINAYSQIN